MSRLRDFLQTPATQGVVKIAILVSITIIYAGSYAASITTTVYLTG